ncbi:MAG: helix-turn-helix domain-containing protein [Pirellulaceae bacterium]
MAGKFVELNDAAKMIGVSPEDLAAMRSKGEIFGYRDGASWKFKLEEVERVGSERAGTPRGDSSIMSGNDEDFEKMISGLSSKILAEKAQEESGSILVSEEELGVSATGQSTIIGKPKKGQPSPADSDIQLASDSSLMPGSDKLLEAPGNKLSLGSEADHVLSGSDIHVKGGSGTGDMPGIAPLASGSSLDLGHNLSLDEEGDMELGSDSALDDELRLDKTAGGTGSGKGSDVTLGSGDSGINLAPTDSGLSLDEEPLELGGSSVESLELPEDDDEVISLENEADPDQATQLKADNEFLLSPGDNQAEDESDSGSQVIALEDSEAFDQEAATMLRADAGGPLAADVFQPAPGAEMGMGPGMGAGQPVYVQVPVQEAPYSIWNVISLSLIVLMLALSGMLMVDVMLNMWTFGGSGGASTAIADFFVKTFNLDS